MSYSVYITSAFSIVLISLLVSYGLVKNTFKRAKKQAVAFENEV